MPGVRNLLIRLHDESTKTRKAKEINAGKIYRDEERDRERNRETERDTERVREREL